MRTRIRMHAHKIYYTIYIVPVINSLGNGLRDVVVTLYKVKSSILIIMHVVISLASCSKT